jgi:hypothetical protein
MTNAPLKVGDIVHISRWYRDGERYGPLTARVCDVMSGNEDFRFHQIDGELISGVEFYGDWQAFSRLDGDRFKVIPEDEVPGHIWARIAMIEMGVPPTESTDND